MTVNVTSTSTPVCSEKRAAVAGRFWNTPQPSCITRTVVPGSNVRICVLLCVCGSIESCRADACIRSLEDLRAERRAESRPGRRGHHPVLDHGQCCHQLGVPAGPEGADALLN